MINETSKYRGKVTVAIKKGSKTINKSTHNAGLPDMARLFAKAVTGNLDFAIDTPRILDIGYTVNDTNSKTEPSEDVGVWESILNSPCAIGGRQYKYEPTLKNWVGELTTTVLATDLNGAMLPNVVENADLGNYNLKIRLCSYRNTDRRYFAEIDIDSDFITQLRNSTSAIVTWECELLYNEESSASKLYGEIIKENN